MSQVQNTKSPKYKLGDYVRDSYSGKSGAISTMNLSETDVDNLPNPTWYYSIDRLGWLFYPEDDLEAL